MTPTALILRRCYPVPVTFKDLRAAHSMLVYAVCPEHGPIWTGDEDGCCTACGADAMEHLRARWTIAIKEATGALDEVYAVVDGREVRVAIIGESDIVSQNPRCDVSIADLLDKADREGYWFRPHEVHLEMHP